ncbi:MULTISPECIES: 50S ribosomal protein L32 [Vagococcus]|uniref:50S ribosomal protein L32 n=1 Tax=Vagococcus TaxID=2737 RepID=UPI000E52735B|nr:MULTISPECIES: 50S ribosomal protein L32 [Vagococcus]RHH69049.1 50S ribosomal protein L32 [Vagococcus sp. AM17-17]
MAVPKRKTSKAKKNARQTHKKLSSTVSYDSVLGVYKRSHYVSRDGYYKGRKVI